MRNGSTREWGGGAKCCVERRGGLQGDVSMRAPKNMPPVCVNE